MGLVSKINWDWDKQQRTDKEDKTLVGIKTPASDAVALDGSKLDKPKSNFRPDKNFKRWVDMTPEEQEARREQSSVEGKERYEKMSEEERQELKGKEFYDFEKKPASAALLNGVKEHKDITFVHCGTSGLKGGKTSEKVVTEKGKEVMVDYPTQFCAVTMRFNPDLNCYIVKDSLEIPMMSIPKEVLNRTLEEIAKGGYDVFTTGGIDKDAYVRNEGVVPMEAAVKAINNYIQKQEGVITGYNTTFVSSMMAHSGCDIKFDYDLMAVANEHHYACTKGEESAFGEKDFIQKGERVTIENIYKNVGQDVMFKGEAPALATASSKIFAESLFMMTIIEHSKVLQPTVPIIPVVGKKPEEGKLFLPTYSKGNTIFLCGVPYTEPSMVNADVSFVLNGADVEVNFDNASGKSEIYAIPVAEIGKGEVKEYDHDFADAEEEYDEDYMNEALAEINEAEAGAGAVPEQEKTVQEQPQPVQEAEQTIVQQAQSAVAQPAVEQPVQNEYTQIHPMPAPMGNPEQQISDLRFLAEQLAIQNQRMAEQNRLIAQHTQAVQEQTSIMSKLWASLSIVAPNMEEYLTTKTRTTDIKVEKQSAQEFIDKSKDENDDHDEHD